MTKGIRTLVAGVAMVVVGTAGVVATAGHVKESYHTVQVVVHGGDTLNKIAGQVAPQYNANDVVEHIYLVDDTGNKMKLTSSVIQPGWTLAVELPN